MAKKKKWTMDSARSYITKVQKGKQQIGLTYCSAVDFLVRNGSVVKTKVEPQDDSVEIDI